MKIWAISDLHFSYSGRYDMKKFGEIWNNSKEKLISNWRKKISREDIVLLPGDLSWEYEMQTAYHDLKQIAILPGKKKIITRGNHDIWWDNITTVKNSVPASIIPLAEDIIEIDDWVITGSMGWISPNDPVFDVLDRNSFEKEYEIARKNLAKAKLTNKRIIYLIHFPPFTTDGKETQFSQLMMDNSVSVCLCGHFHMPKEWASFQSGVLNGVNFQLVSTDYLGHDPIEINT